MEISLQQLENNFTQVTVGDLTVYFSYSTPVAYQLSGYGLVCSENIWSSTTGKHLSQIQPDRKARVKHDEFVRGLNAIIKQTFGG